MIRAPSSWFRREPFEVPAWPLWLVTVALFVVSALVAPRGVAGDLGPAAAGGGVADLEGLERAFRCVVEQVAPYVVGIRAQRPATVPGAGDDEQRVAINGSGTIISEDGLILTSEHVVQAATDIEVLFHDGQRLQALVVAADPRSDLAVLQTVRAALRPAALCNWSDVARGQWIVVLGNPFGLGHDGQLSVSVGVIANLGRQLPGLGEADDRFYNDMIQITAPISPGNSGGPLFNIHGELVGVVTAMHTRAPADDGVGFAVPMTPVKRRLVNLLAQGRPIEYGYLGAVVRLPDATERVLIGRTYGVVVQRVEPEGPAAQAGLTANDVILAFDDQAVTGPGQLAELVGQSPVGTSVHLELLRGGQTLSLRVALDLRDVSRVTWMRGGTVCWRGMRLEDLSGDARRRMCADAPAAGVIVTDVVHGSPANRANIQIGDVIDEVDGQPVRDTLEFLKRVHAVQGPLGVFVRNGGPRAVGP